MFQQCEYAVLNKIDLLPYLPFDPDQAVAFARQVNPQLRFLFTSALTGDGIDQWCNLVRDAVHRGPAAPAVPFDRLPYGC